jgi:hypothetical protein
MPIAGRLDLARLAVHNQPVPESKGSFENTLRARGWVDVACACLVTLPTYTPLSQRTRLLPPGLVSVQYHLRRHVVAEIVGGRAPQGSTMGAQTFSNRDYAQTRLSYSGPFVGAVLSYHQRGLQVGIGPVLRFAHWRLTDSLVPYSTGGYPVVTEARWSGVPVGIVGDARYHRLIGDRTFMAVRAEVRRFRKARTPGTPRFPPAMVDQGSSFVGVGFGVVF